MCASGAANSSCQDSSLRNCLVVCGPTASGKTALGVELALDLGGEILSADSRQVYRGMDIGTGKDIDQYETPRGKVPYHLIDVADPDEIYSLFDYQRDFYRAFAEVSSRGRLPVIVGGTGLYIEAALRKFEVPDVPADQPFRDEMMARDLDGLVEELKGRSPSLAGKTVLDCKRRVVRALEIARHTERFGEPAVIRTDLELRPLVLLVTWPREELRQRVRGRLRARLESGMIGEVRAILERGIPEARYDLFGMEYRHAARFLAGEVTEEQMVEDLFHDIMYLARRQETYFRGIQKRGLEAHAVERADLQVARKIVPRFRFAAHPAEP